MSAIRSSDAVPDSTLSLSIATPTVRPATPLHIVHVVPSVNPAHGGPAAVSVRLADAQSALGHKVTLISALAPKHREDFAQANAGLAHLHRVQLLLVPWTTPASQWFGARLLPLFSSVLPYADVLHIHGIWEPMLLTAARKAADLGCPYIVRPCGMLDPYSLSQKRFKKRVALSLLHNRFIQRAALLHVLNTDEARLIEPLGFSPPRAVIPNGVNLDEVDDTSGENRFADYVPRLFHDGRAAPYVLFVGRLHHKKGLDLLIEAFAPLAEKFPDLHLLAIGPDGGSRAAFLQTAAARGIAHRVHAPGPLYGPAKFAAYRNAACLCLPSRQEGFSVAIAEALACRIPVAISADSHFPEVQSTGAGLVFSLNKDSITDALATLLAHSPRQRRAMTTAGRELVETHYTWTRMAQMTVDAYARHLHT